jgi:hypothetical protein
VANKNRFKTSGVLQGKRIKVRITVVVILALSPL